MDSWGQGRATVDQLIASGNIERVPPDIARARDLTAKARVHLKSAEALADTDTATAYDALHSANRKALTAILLTQGLRPTRSGGHTAVFDVVRAQLDPPLGSILAPYTRIRRTRNAADYKDELPATSDDVRRDIPLCEAIINASDRVIGQLPLY